MSARKVNSRSAEQCRTSIRKATGGTGVWNHPTQSELASNAGKFVLRPECGDCLCEHSHCARSRKRRADAAKRAAVEPGRCGKPTRKGTCRSPAGRCPNHDKPSAPAFAW